MEFPGGRVPFTSALSFVGGVFDAAPKLPCYRTLDGRGQPIDGAALPHALGKDEAVALYVAMARLQVCRRPAPSRRLVARVRACIAPP